MSLIVDSIKAFRPRLRYISYEESSVSPMIITLLSLLLGVIFLEAVVSGPTTLHWLLVIMLLFCFTSFYGMWVGSDDEYLYQVWGLGLFSRKVKIASIRSCYLAKNNTLLGWILNPLSPLVVQIVTTDGVHYIFPVDDCNQLIDYIARITTLKVLEP